MPKEGGWHISRVGGTAIAVYQEPQPSSTSTYEQIETVRDKRVRNLLSPQWPPFNRSTCVGTSCFRRPARTTRLGKDVSHRACERAAHSARRRSRTLSRGHSLDR